MLIKVDKREWNKKWKAGLKNKEIIFLFSFVFLVWSGGWGRQ